MVARLKRLLGAEAANFLSYTEKIWKGNAYPFANYPQPVRPHQHNSHPLFEALLMKVKEVRADTETCFAYGGYLEEAVYRGSKSLKQFYTSWQKEIRKT